MRINDVRARHNDVRAARRNLRKVLFAARNAPWRVDLAIDGERVRWNPASDVARFRAALSNADWQTADALYRGMLCEGLEDTDAGPWSGWMLAERHRLHDQWRVAVMTSGPPFAGITRSFASFRQAAAENADSRVHAGGHFRSACHDGVALGQKIGRRAARMYLQAVAQ